MNTNYIWQEEIKGKIYRVFEDFDSFDEWGFVSLGEWNCDFGVVPCDICSISGKIKENFKKAIWGIKANEEWEALDYYIAKYV